MRAPSWCASGSWARTVSYANGCAPALTLAPGCGRRTSDDFLAEIKKAVLAEKPDALLLGEVWEDASNKISYGHLRRYLQGSELDSAMDYPFRDMVIGFLMGYKNAYQAAEDIETLRENYPREALACALNLLSSHDRPRIISVLGGGPDESQLPESERSKWRLDENSMGLAKSRFWLATLMQMTFPGVPSIYYGDEYGLEGLTDPGNRRTLPTKDQLHDFDTLAIVKNASAIRRALPFMVDGEIKAFALNDDVLAYTRTAKTARPRRLSSTAAAQFALRDDSGARRMRKRRDQRPRVRNPQRYRHARPVPAGLFDHLSPCREAPAGAARPRRGRRMPHHLGADR